MPSIIVRSQPKLQRFVVLNLVNVAVKFLTTDTHKCTFPLDIRQSVRDENVKLSTLIDKVGRSCKCGEFLTDLSIFLYVYVK